MTARRHARQAGFTLLEAIIAMVIMATTLMALYAWLASSTLGAARAAERATSLSDARTAVAYLERVNPMTDPDGSVKIGGFALTWHAEAVTERRTGRAATGEPSPYDYQLYDMQVELARDGAVTRNFSMRRAGWVATRVIDPNEL